MSLNEKLAPLPVLTIERTRGDRVLSTIEDVDSTHSLTPNLTPTATRHADDRETSPFSPFYSHSSTRVSMDANKSESKQHITSYDTDVEACLTETKTNALTTTMTCKNTNNECTVWPGQRALQEKKKLARRQRGCNPMRNLDKRTKIWVKILIALIVIGAAVGVGLGVSKAVGGGIWKSSSSTNAAPA